MMEQTPNTSQHEDELEPFIPPHYMLYLAVIGLVITGITLFSQAELTVIGWGGLGLAGLSLVAWVLMAPEAATAFFTGRTVRIGVTTVLISVVFLVALVAIYAFVANQGWRLDVTESDEFSLSDPAYKAISTMSVDPTKSLVRIYAFYGIAQAGNRDRDTLLFDEYVDASGGKVSYEFIDPDLNPLVVEKYGDPRAGQLVVASLGENGEPDIENAETITLSNQETLTNAVLSVASSGDFRAYFLTVESGLSVDDTSGAGFSSLKDSLELNKWSVDQVAFFDLTSPDSAFKLDDPAADGIVLVIPGGTSPLPDEQLQVITDYLDNGGDLVLLSTIRADGQTLATADNLSNYLFDNFGFKVNNDVVLDRTASLQSPLYPIAIDFSSTHFITSAFGADSFVAMQAPHSISINPTTPPNVIVTALVNSSPVSFARADLASLQTDEAITQLDTDTQGPFTLAVAAENTVTGARIVAFGTQYVGTNNDEVLSSLGMGNMTMALFGTAWAGNFDTFVTDIPQIGLQTRPQDQPLDVLADLSTINLITVVLLPFGVLAIGIFVWLRGREKSVTR